VDDHPMVQQALCELVNGERDLLCCGTAASLPEAEKAIIALKPELLLLDLRLGHADGLDAIKGLRVRFPEVRILVISVCDETVYAERALRAGAMGYVMKERATEEVLEGIRAVMSGQFYVSPKVSMIALKRMIEDKPLAQHRDLGSLTDRELHVLAQIGAGWSNKQIAAAMHLSVKTIETYREHLKYKLGLPTGSELVQFAGRYAHGTDRRSS
jgi:DNA-binding NarL/FixJ family response regulator